MRYFKIETECVAKVSVNGKEINEILSMAADLAHEVLEELSIYRQQNNLDSDAFCCEGSACAFLDAIGD